MIMKAKARQCNEGSGMLGFFSTSTSSAAHAVFKRPVVRRVRVQTSQTCKRFQINIIFNLQKVQKFVALYKN